MTFLVTPNVPRESSEGHINISINGLEDPKESSKGAKDIHLITSELYVSLTVNDTSKFLKDVAGAETSDTEGHG